MLAAGWRGQAVRTLEGAAPSRSTCRAGGWGGRQCVCTRGTVPGPRAREDRGPGCSISTAGHRLSARGGSGARALPERACELVVAAMQSASSLPALAEQRQELRGCSILLHSSFKQLDLLWVLLVWKASQPQRDS